MDATTIQEIANQLGIAVDQVMEYLPAYANAQWWGFFIPLVVSIILTVVSGILLIIFKLKSIKWDAVYDKTKYYYSGNEEDRMLHHKAAKLMEFYEIGVWVSIFALAVGIIGLLICMIVCPERLIGWSTAPELMFLKSLV